MSVWILLVLDEEKVKPTTLELLISSIRIGITETSTIGLVANQLSFSVTWKHFQHYAPAAMRAIVTAL